MPVNGCGYDLALAMVKIISYLSEKENRNETDVKVLCGLVEELCHEEVKEFLEAYIADGGGIQDLTDEEIAKVINHDYAGICEMISPFLKNKKFSPVFPDRIKI